MSTESDNEEWLGNVEYDGCAHEESDWFDEEDTESLSDVQEDGNAEDDNDNDANFSSSPNTTESEHVHTNDAHGEDRESGGQEEEEEEALIHSKQFKSSEDAYVFYNEYARHIGFSVRKDILRRVKDKFDATKLVESKRRFVCSCEGEREKKHFFRPNRKKPPRNLTRFGCKAKLEVVYNQDSKMWSVNNFLSQHNGHQLVPSPSSMSCRSHRHVNEEDAILVENLNDAGIKKSEAMNYLVNRAGQFSNVGFIKSDLYNCMDRRRQVRCSGGDANTLISSMKKLSEDDPLFYHEHEVNGSGELVRLFWADSESRKDYHVFGDLLLFDSTYRSNRYSLPIVIFAGVNNHRQSVVFGFALMTQETVESYTWALTAFLHGMDGKEPKSVITDGDQAIRRALVSTLPSVTHRLCSWHLLENCKDNVKIKGFHKDFRSVMFMKRSPEEFEQKWEELVATYKVQDHNWVKEVFKKRERWAEAYLEKDFFAGCRSNQRCESLNSVVRRKVTHGMSLVELVEKIRLAVSHIRHREHHFQVKSITSEPVYVTHLTEYAKQAVSLYTLSAFDVFKKQLQSEAMYCVDNKFVREDGVFVYTVSRHRCRNRKSLVQYNPAEPSAKCSCMLFESYGFPCRHMFLVFKNEDLEELPKTCILRRWTKEAKSIAPVADHVPIGENVASAIRRSELMNDCRKLCSRASQSDASFEKFKDHLASFQTSNDCSQAPLEEPMITSEAISQDHTRGNSPLHATHVHDPPVVPSRGRRKKRYKSHRETRNQNHCSHCDSTLHTIATCDILYPDRGNSSGNRASVEQFTEGVNLSDNDDIQFERTNFASEERNNVARENTNGENVGGRLCTGCSQPGHNRQTCPKLKAEGGRERAPRKKNSCSKCKEEGHSAPKCPMLNASSSQGGQDNVERKKRKCTNCREEGHTANKCPTSNSAAASTEVDGVEKIIGEDGTVSFVVST